MTRRFQFSLTWLAIAALVFGAFFGGVATGRRCYELENERQLQEIRANVERSRRLEELAARRQAKKPFVWDGGVEYRPPGPEFKLQPERAERAVDE